MDKTYGPYTAKEDPTAIPKDNERAEYMTGVELRQGEDILFRGGMLESGDSYLLYNEDGTLDNFRFMKKKFFDNNENVINDSALFDQMSFDEWLPSARLSATVGYVLRKNPYLDGKPIFIFQISNLKEINYGVCRM